MSLIVNLWFVSSHVCDRHSNNEQTLMNFVKNSTRNSIPKNICLRIFIVSRQSLSQSVINQSSRRKTKDKFYDPVLCETLQLCMLLIYWCRPPDLFSNWCINIKTSKQLLFAKYLFVGGFLVVCEHSLMSLQIYDVETIDFFSYPIKIHN